MEFGAHLSDGLCSFERFYIGGVVLPKKGIVAEKGARTREGKDVDVGWSHSNMSSTLLVVATGIVSWFTLRFGQ